MNILKSISLILLVFVLGNSSFAIEKSSLNSNNSNPIITVSDLSELSISDYERVLNRELKLKEKLAVIAVKVTDKIVPDFIQKKAAKSSGDGSTSALLGLIFGVAGFVFLFIPYLGSLSLLLGPSAIVLSSIALSRINKSDSSDGLGMAIIGLIGGILTTIVILIAVAFVAAFLF